MKVALINPNQSRCLIVKFATSNSVLSTNQITGHGPSYDTTGIDPWFLIKPDRRLKSGWYQISLKAELPQGADPKLYFNYGTGFQERFVCYLHEYKGDYSALVRSYKPALNFRLDPCEIKCEVKIHELTIMPASILSLTINQFRQLFHVFRMLLQKPVQWRKCLANLRQEYFTTRGFAALPVKFQPQDDLDPYARWLKRYDYNPMTSRDLLKTRLSSLKTNPLISVLMPVFNSDADFLEQAIKSVMSQLYENWELCIADDCSTLPHIKNILQKWAAADPRIKVIFRKKNGHISAATNSAFKMATGEWIALLDHDDKLPEHALAEIALEIDQHPDTELIYTDEDKIDHSGKRHSPHFKPDFSLDLLRSMNYFNHLTVHRAENISKLKGWRSNFNGSQDYDLNLRVIEKVPPSKIRHIPKVLYHWRSIKGSTAFSQDEKNYAYQAGLIALAEHIDRCKLAATVEPIPDIPFYRFRYHLPKPEPMVSLIIPTRDNVVLLKQCISSILQRTDYNNYEILIIDNNSIDPKTHEYFKIITSQNNNISVLPYHEGFNYSSINNFAVQYAQGQILGLINNDVEVISSDWLKEMASLAMRPDIGCVGAKLYYPDNTIQHGGVILGLGGVAGHAHKYFTREAPGYFHRLRVLHNLSAVTGACLLIRKHIFEQVGGLEQNNLAVAFNDVDLCLRVRKAGYLNLFTPFAELYHHESISRGKEDTEEKRARFQRELTYMRKYWGNELNYDPYYSPNLSLDTEDFAIRK